MKKLLAACALLTGVAVCVSAQVPGGSAEPQNGSIQHDGLMRTFVYYVPDNLPDTPVPLVFMLHGGGGSARRAMNATTEGRWNELADQHKFIVVYPQGVNNHWNDCRADFTGGSDAADVGFIGDLIGEFSANYNVDPQRVYATGHSNGGMMALRLAIELSDKIAAVYTNTGALAAASECSGPVEPIAVMYLSGTADPLIPFEGGPIRSPGGASNGTVLSARETVDFWVDFLGADTTPAVTNVPDRTPDDGSTVTVYSYGNGAEGTEVLFYQVDGGGHGWPSPTQFPPGQQAIVGKKNQDIVACDEAWAFFQRHTLESAPPAETPPAISSASRAGKLLHIDGTRFGSSGATVVVNGKDVSSFITAQADTQITLRGKNKKLNLKKGANQIVVTVDGRPSNTYVLTL